MRQGVMKSSRRHFDAMRPDSKMTGYPQPKSAHHQRGFLLDAKLITNNRTNCSKDEQQPCGFVLVGKHCAIRGVYAPESLPLKETKSPQWSTVGLVFLPLTAKALIKSDSGLQPSFGRCNLA